MATMEGRQLLALLHRFAKPARVKNGKGSIPLLSAFWKVAAIGGQPVLKTGAGVKSRGSNPIPSALGLDAGAAGNDCKS